MQTFTILLFALTYLGMAAGRVPGLKIDRAGIALLLAAVAVASGALPPGEVAGAMDFPTLLLLAGLMVLSARVRAAGIYARAALWIGRQSANPHRLLALTIGVGGLLSAVLVNDIVVFAMAPILCTSLAARGLDPRPYLFALAAASNAGSAASLIGNPQNILIGQVGGLGFWSYAASAALPALAALAISYVCIALVWRRHLLAVPEVPAAPPADIPRAEGHRGETALCLGALFLLLALFTTPLPREISALLVAGGLMLSRAVPSRQLLDEIDAPLLILFASLFAINGAFALTGLPEAAVAAFAEAGWLPERLSFLLPFTLAASNTIGNVPAVILLLQAWTGLPDGALTALALLSTLAGNLLLVGSLANLIVAERAARSGVMLTFRDHAKAGVPITLLSMGFAALWLWFGGHVAL
ncbi:MAG: anion transporter [Nisaea sp.]|uniref:SLC13 family permease n=1 Tax=Nisaea sp. TaxID=2024842 RepID=UPI001B1C5C6B|nr:SLC13 family permease [Nisaea sp.]MBO6560920.1 anion transporter [Nisaea sp.]